MTNHDAKELVVRLLHADTQDDVVAILQDAGFWGDRNLWRLYGDKEGNFAQAGNQQALPEAALVEKVVNCGDARLLAQCLEAGIDPESDRAPKNVRDAVAMFFEGRRAELDEAGTLVNWPKAKRTDESREITVAATGDRPTRGRPTRKMCLTISDQGEGQSPKRLPITILSLNAKNKQRIPFVQGKFNMGGSGALRFCGKKGLQLVISRRRSTLATGTDDPTQALWGVTVVRREQPSNKSGEPIHSEFTYLAPVGADVAPRQGEVLSFAAETMPLMPEHDEPYVREVESGTAIKMYEYETDVGQSNILMKDGLLFALERLLPEIALPVRLHECRGYKGEKERSFETPLSGLVVRLEDGKGDNLEPGFPISVQLSAAGMKMNARIYAFKEEKAATYLKNEGVIFMINGQAHGNLPKSIFSRPKAVGLPRLKDSLLVLMDCSSLTAVQREDLFMSSRDRLSKNPVRFDLEREIELMLRNSTELRKLQQERRERDVESQLSEEKPLEEVLGRVLKASPTLKMLFLKGQRLSRPFAGGGAKEGEADGRKRGPGEMFKGARHPHYFRVAKHEYGKVYRRNCEEGRRCRIKFETDAENGYFDRATDRGTFELQVIDAAREMSEPSYSLTLEEGEAHLNMALPPEAEVGDHVVVQATVNDPVLFEPFVNVICLTVLRKQKHTTSDGPSPRRPTKRGSGDDPAKEGIALPKIVSVKESDEHWRKHKFTVEDGCHVITEPVTEDGKEQLAHTFYVNVDNAALKTEMKYTKQDPRLLEAKFKYGVVLLGLGMLHDQYRSNGDTVGDTDEISVEDNIRNFTRAISTVLLPVIDQLSGLDEASLAELSEAGEDD